MAISAAVPKDSDDRAIRILGATAVEFDSMLHTVDGCAPAALAVATALYEQEETVGQTARALLALGNSWLVMWGTDPLPNALRAAEAAPALGDTEVFHRTKQLV